MKMRGVGRADLEDQAPRRVRLKKLGNLPSPMKWQLVVEYRPEAALYAGSVPGLNLKVEALNEKEAFRLLKEALPLHLRMLAEVGQNASPGRAKILEFAIDSPYLPGQRRPKPKRAP